MWLLSEVELWEGIWEWGHRYPLLGFGMGTGKRKKWMKDVLSISFFQAVLVIEHIGVKWKSAPSCCDLSTKLRAKRMLNILILWEKENSGLWQFKVHLDQREENTFWMKYAGLMARTLQTGLWETRRQFQRWFSNVKKDRIQFSRSMTLFDNGLYVTLWPMLPSHGQFQVLAGQNTDKTDSCLWGWGNAYWTTLSPWIIVSSDQRKALQETIDDLEFKEMEDDLFPETTERKI